MRTIGENVAHLSGYAPTIPTPFDEDGNIDAAAFERFCDRQVQEGATALVVGGTTGEAPTLIPVEHRALIRLAVGVARGRIPVIAGAGSNSTEHAIELTKDAEAARADAVLSVVPYYNKPMQAGLYLHFRSIVEATGLPVFLHDVPSRTVCGLADETIGRLAELPRIIGLKDAAGDVTRPARLRRLVGPDFRLLSGDDATAFAYLTQGGNGCISITSNLAPGLCRNLFMACRLGQIANAQQLAFLLGELTAILLRESSPAPLKYALDLLGFMSAKVRLPLVELTGQTKAEVAGALVRICDAYPEYMIGTISGRARNRRTVNG